ncbi:DUF6090 family protein [Algoriphagus namhaensis]|uniref:DUF6090 family protein n=1 Tax=Algoriphagus namhaensis TaxID=915353 RepID=A0ABV8AW61_9BACT
MLQFFRKIRQKLLLQNKFTRYLIYGVGEIVLVVIGILLALAINGWNEDRKTIIKEQQILKAISLNLSKNVEVFEQNMSLQSDYINQIDILLDHLENGKPYEDSLGHYFRRLIYLEQVTVNTSAYETLKSLGFELIQSETLRSEIIDLFGYNYPNSSNLVRDVSLQSYAEKASEMKKNFRVSLDRAQAVPLDYVALQKDLEFINYIYQLRGWKLSVIDVNLQLLDPTKALLKNINDYLDQPI